MAHLFLRATWAPRIAFTRRPEFDHLPALFGRGVPVMAYSPVEQGRLPIGGPLRAVADRHGVTAYQAALAWVVRKADVLAIPKAADVAHVRQNRAAADLALTSQDLAEIDAVFPPPRRATSLDMF